MADTIKTGTILIAEGSLLPESISLESEPYAYGWRLVKNLDGNGLDQIISQAGWNFFYIAGVIETSAFGSDEKKTTRKAIKQVIASLKSKNFNCLGITRVVAIVGTALHKRFRPLAAYSRRSGSFGRIGAGLSVRNEAPGGRGKIMSKGVKSWKHKYEIQYQGLWTAFFNLLSRS
jgi:hypothetical protein